MADHVMTTDHLRALLEQKHEQLQQLRDLGMRQLERIDAGDMTMLMKILAGKQRLLAELQTIEHRLDPFRTEAPESRVWRNRSERDHCAQLMTRCQLLFSEVIAQEREAELRLSQQRDDAERQLHGMHPAAGARGAYLQDTAMCVSSFDLATES